MIKRYGMFGLLMACAGFAYGMGGMDDDFSLSYWRNLRSRQMVVPMVRAVQSIKSEPDNVRLQEITTIKKNFQNDKEALVSKLKVYEDRANRMQKGVSKSKRVSGETHVFRELPAAKANEEMVNDLMKVECGRWSPFSKCEQYKLELDNARKNRILVETAKKDYAKLDKVNYLLENLENEERKLRTDVQKVSQGGIYSSIPMRRIYNNINWFAKKWWGLQ